MFWTLFFTTSHHDHPESEVYYALQKSDKCAAETCRGDRDQRLCRSYKSHFLSGKQERQLDTLRSICFSLNVQKGQITVADENIHLEAEMFLCPADVTDREGNQFLKHLMSYTAGRYNRMKVMTAAEILLQAGVYNFLRFKQNETFPYWAASQHKHVVKLFTCRMLPRGVVCL